MRVVFRLPLLPLFLAVLPFSAAGQDVGVGKSLYERHCATCHGLSAKGDGPMAPALLIQPTDLTLLSSGEDGRFPLMRVIMRIDGRDPLVSHGSPMPVYGDFFEGVQSVALKTGAGQPVMMSEPVADLVTYLKSLQE
ncbi:Cytochrome c [Roseivivax sp. THAF40]|uniref:c-type cytochrome n=1 Tax=unclassified Roseivivax TaxID=2639302 RepID=UPI001267E30B|nr:MULTISPECIES: cytochrome c [unclassified Roseivivax]QFS83945.1 Cytochrome c [Roseivivax sp. THAF197b]QFT47777.1 Cytochrome c [Roseivivax sp. THAF40]